MCHNASYKGTHDASYNRPSQKVSPDVLVIGRSPELGAWTLFDV